VNFHCVPNQVLYQAEPLPDLMKSDCRAQKIHGRTHHFVKIIALADVSLVFLQCRPSEGSVRDFL